MRDTIVVLSEPKVVGDATDRGIYSLHTALLATSCSRFWHCVLTAGLAGQQLCVVKLRSGEADAASASVFAFVWCLEEEEEEVVDERRSSYIT